jgi:F-type H+-transporting ATPase subunit O
MANITTTLFQQLDSKTLSRLETAVSKSNYAGQGKKLKVTNKVRKSICFPPSSNMLC